MMMRKELGVQSQQIELYNIYELLYNTLFLCAVVGTSFDILRV